MTRRFSGPEPLENRIAPALAYALDANNTLLSFDLAEPGTILSSMAISGLAGGETLLGMDLRPADGNLYGVGSGGNLYMIDPGSGTASFIAALAADPADLMDPFTGFSGSFHGIDFTPTADRLRVISDSGANLRINPNTGLVITDEPLAFAGGDPNAGTSPTLTGAAYTNSYSGATGTTLYAIDTQLNALTLINPPNGGTVLTVGSLGVDPTSSTAFDIAPNSTDAYAIMTVGGVTGLYQINLGSGAAKFVGGVGNGLVETRGFVILPGDLTLVNDRTATYVDADGDRVTVKVSKGQLSANDFRLIPSGPIGAQLAAVNLSDDGGEFVGASITITAVKPAKGGSGDGFANVGQILADVDLNKVKVDGDLGRVRAGDNSFDNNKGVGLQSLQVHSLGVFGTDTGADNIVSTVSGTLKSVRIQSDLAGAIAVSGLERGDIGSVKIGGSLSGGDEEASGRLTATGDIGAIKIGGDVRGGAGIDSGRISAGGDIKSLKVGGSLIGGFDAGGALLAQVQSNGDIGKVTIKHDISGGVTPGSAAIYAEGSLRQVKISGSLTGGDGEFSGHIGANGDIGAVIVRGSVVGGNGDFSGSIYSQSGGIKKLQIGGALVGGQGDYFNTPPPSFQAQPIGRALDASEGAAAQIFAATGIGKLQIREGMIGGAGESSASVESNGAIKKAIVGGSLIGGTGVSTAGISAETLVSVRIGGSVDGRESENGGVIFSANDIRSISIKGSLLGGTEQSGGRVDSVGEIRKLTIGGDVRGGGEGSGTITAGALGKVAIGGNLVGSDLSGVDAVAILSETTIAQLKVKGDVRGSGDSSVVIVAGTTPGDARKSATIGKIDIGGSATRVDILAGFSLPGGPVGGIAEIGKVAIKGDFIASNIVAAVDAGADGFWGTADDTAPAQSTSRIGSVQIKGQAAGSGEIDDHFGIVAKALGKVQAGGLKLEIPQSITDPPKTIGWAEDLTIRVVS